MTDKINGPFSVNFGSSVALQHDGHIRLIGSVLTARVGGVELPGIDLDPPPPPPPPVEEIALGRVSQTGSIQLVRNAPGVNWTSTLVGSSYRFPMTGVTGNIIVIASMAEGNLDSTKIGGIGPPGGGPGQPNSGGFSVDVIRERNGGFCCDFEEGGNSAIQFVVYQI